MPDDSLADARLYPADELSRLAEETFSVMGARPDDARTAARNLIAADLRGIDSHGVARLRGYYRLSATGRLRADAALQIVHQTPATATLDAGAGLGLVAAERAMALAIDKAGQTGAGWVAVRNSNHFGIAGQYALMAARQGMIGWAFTNASPLVAPYGGMDRLLGTNPIAVALPGGRYDPIVADMATSAAANGKLEILQRTGGQAPEGWIQDAEGQPTADPKGVSQGGALLPLGTLPSGGGHKGYALASIVDLLAGVLPGAGFGPWVPPFVSFLTPREDAPGQGIGHFFGALRVDAFRPISEYERDVELWIDTFRASRPTQSGTGQVLIPGQPEAECARRRAHEGIPLIPTVIADLESLADELSIKRPCPWAA